MVSMARTGLFNLRLIVKGSDGVTAMENFNIPHISNPDGRSITDKTKLGELVDNSENTEPGKRDDSKDQSTDTIVRKALEKVALPSTDIPSTSMPYSSVFSNVDNLPPQGRKIEKHFLWRCRWRMTDTGQSDKQPTLAASHFPVRKTEQHLVSRFTQPPPPIVRMQLSQESREHSSDPVVPDYHLRPVSRAERVARMENLGNGMTQGLSPRAATKPTESSHSEALGNPAPCLTTNLSRCQELQDNPQLAILDTKEATAISSQSKLKESRKLLLGGRSKIPFRSSSYQVELIRTRASQIQIQNTSQTYHHISTDIAQENLVTRNIHQRLTPQAGQTVSIPDECIGVNIKAHHERDPAESASTPIITITGLDPDPPFLRESIHLRMESRTDGKDRATDRATDRGGTPPISSSQSSEQALYDESVTRWEHRTPTSSRPTTPRSDSQSSEPDHKTRGTDTTSTGHVMIGEDPPPTPLQTQAGGLCQVPRQRPRTAPVRRALGKRGGLGAAMSPPHHHKISQGQIAEAQEQETNDASLSHHQGSNKVYVADQCQVPTDYNETLIQEAARIAMQRSRAKEIVTTRSHTPCPGTQDIQKVVPTMQPLPAPKGNRSCGVANIDLSVLKMSSLDEQLSSPSQLLAQQHKGRRQEKGQGAKQLRLKKEAEGLAAHGKDSRREEIDFRRNTKTYIATALVSSVLTVCMIWLGFACAWWAIVKPAFDQRSHLWRRKRRRESTWEDVCVFAAAGVFFVVCALLLAGGVRTGLWAVMNI